jgi:hypothetical protein
MLGVIPCEYIQCSTVDEMVSAALMAIRCYAESSLIITLNFNNFDEQTEFLQSMYKSFSNDAQESCLPETALVMFQEEGTPETVPDGSYRFVSPSTIEQVVAFTGCTFTCGDVFALVNPTDLFSISYFCSYISASHRVGLSLIGLLTFVKGGPKKIVY